MELSIIIVNYNTATLLSRCLTSLQDYVRDVGAEVCVIDNASADDSTRLVQGLFPRVRLIANARNVGFAAAINQGLRQTGGRYVLWLNPDTELMDTGIANLIRYLNDHTDVGIIGPQIVNPRGYIEPSCRSFPSYGAALGHRYSLLTRWFPWNRYSRYYLHTDSDHTAVQRVDWVSGACLLHRREVLDDIDLLDERFFMYCEDVDFCLRASRCGWSVYYHPGARVLHHIAASTRKVAEWMIVERHRSIWRYYAKHFRRHVLKDALVAPAIWGRCASSLTQHVLGTRHVLRPLEDEMTSDLEPQAASQLTSVIEMHGCEARAAFDRGTPPPRRSYSSVEAQLR